MGRDVDAQLSTALRSTLDGRWAKTRDAVRDSFDSSFVSPPGADVVEQREHVDKVLHKLADSGFPHDGFRVEDGGGGDTGAALTAFEMLGYFDLSVMVKAGVQWGLFGGAITNLGDSEIRKEFIPGVMDLDIKGCFAMTELGHGSDVQHLETTATYDPTSGTFDLHSPTRGATKAYIGGAGESARWAAVFAQLITGGPGQEPQSAGVHCFLTRIRNEDGSDARGVTTSDHGVKGGLVGVDNGMISFDHVAVPRRMLLNRFGNVSEDGIYSSPIKSEGKRFFTMLGTLIRGRVSVGAAAGAAGRTALTIAIRYAIHRHQFTKPGTDESVQLMDYRVHQRRLVPLLARSYALAFAQNSLLESLHTAENNPGELSEIQSRELETHAAGMKAFTTTHANETIGECRLACGGYGYMEENGLTRLRADADVFSTFEGANTILWQLVAKGLLTQYSSEVDDLDPVGLVRFTASMATDIVTERLNVSTIWQKLVDTVTDREFTDLLDRGIQLELLADREHHLLETAARRLQGAQKDDDTGAFDAFNNAQDHILECGKAHMDRVVLESFAEAIDSCENKRAREVLGKLCDVFVLDLVDRNRGWYLEHNRLTSERTKAATTALNELCSEIADVALELVDAFGVPDEVVDVPMLQPL